MIKNLCSSTTWCKSKSRASIRDISYAGNITFSTIISIKSRLIICSRCKNRINYNTSIISFERWNKFIKIIIFNFSSQSLNNWQWVEESVSINLSILEDVSDKSGVSDKSITNVIDIVNTITQKRIISIGIFLSNFLTGGSILTKLLIR